jgi:VanZ family protein
MFPSRLPRSLRLGLFGVAVAILLVLCLLPSKDLPDPGTGDRFEHTAAWFVLTITGYLLAPNRRIVIPAFALAYGAAIEILQGTVGTGRHSDPADFVADSVGVALAVVAFLVARRIRRT